MSTKTDSLFVARITDAYQHGKIKLDPWQRDFITDVQRLLRNNVSLSKRQRETIDKIHSTIPAW